MSTFVGEANRAARNARPGPLPTNRSWLERSLNHPYLGLYPLSYMWGKVLPEMAEFLMFRPFGMKMPGTALYNMLHVYRDVMYAQENDPNFRKFVRDNEPALRRSR
jgi:hypothetical protein